MIKLAPRENQTHELPEQVGGLSLSNETIASIDLEIEQENGTLKLKVMGIYLGKTGESQESLAKKTWKLS